jgi:Domain of unknown function (DUF5076)
MAVLINELKAPLNAGLSEEGGEVLRVWVVEGRLEMSLSPSFPEPDIWGVALVDIARHVARMYADLGVCSEADAHDRLWTMVDAELKRPTDLGKTDPVRKN